jgi:hypothetical protein
MADSRAPVLDPAIIANEYELGNFKTCFDLSIASLSLLLHSFDLCDLEVCEFFNTLISHPGLLVQGPLEKFGFNGLVDGLFAIIIIQNHTQPSHLKVWDQTKSILVA